MPFSPEDIKANADYFRAKLRAEKQVAGVVAWQKGDPAAGDFILVDSRPRDGFARSHIQGAVSLPLGELDALGGQLPKDRELVVYCWNHN